MAFGAVVVAGAAAAGGLVSGGKYLLKREEMKNGDEEIEEERKREREEEALQNLNRRPKTEVFKHFTHQCPLVEIDCTSRCGGRCGVCSQPITSGWAYRCSSDDCHYYLHQVCAKELVALSTCSYSRAQEIQSPATPTTISTFAHKNHQVKEVYSNLDCTCDHCFTAIYGTRFRCDACNVNLHPVCASCPTKISSFMHPQHDLELKTRRHFSVCDICNQKTRSNIRLYRCKTCKFYVHTACSQLPQHLMHKLHPPHPLKLKRAKDSRNCDAKCGDKCECCRWCYECETCNVSIHISCVLQHSIGSTSNKRDIDENIELLIQLVELGSEIANLCH